MKKPHKFKNNHVKSLLQMKLELSLTVITNSDKHPATAPCKEIAHCY